MFGRVYHTGTRGMFGGRTEVAEVSGTGIEFVPNLTGVFGRVLRPYPTLSKTPGRVFTEQIPPVNCGTYPTKRALVTMLYRIIPHNTQEKTHSLSLGRFSKLIFSTTDKSTTAGAMR